MKIVRKLAATLSVLLLVYLVVVVIQTNFQGVEYPSGMVADQTGILPVESFDDGIQTGNQAPDFVLETLDGNVLRLSDLKGKKVFLNFWASWCGPCEDEMPHMQEYHDTFAAESNYEIVAVNMTQRESSKEDVADFVEEYQLTFPIVLDPNGEVEKLYEVLAFPTSYILNEEGVVVHSFKGPITNPADLDALLNSY